MELALGKWGILITSSRQVLVGVSYYSMHFMASLFIQ